MKNFKKSICMHITQADMTIKDLAEISDIPFSTLNSILYKDIKNCMISTAVSLSKALHVSIDELINCETISEEERHILSSVRLLPKHAKQLILWIIKQQVQIYRNNDPQKNKVISVMRPVHKDFGGILPSNDFFPLDISSRSDDVKSKVFLGVELSSENYMPYYSPYDVLLVANDRTASLREHCIVIYYGKLYITRKIHVDCDYLYIPLCDDRLYMREKELDDMVGYVADVCLSNQTLPYCDTSL